jgi:hypothetical protein
MTSKQARACTTLPIRKHPGLLLRGERHLQVTCSLSPRAPLLRIERLVSTIRVGLRQKLRAGSLACHCQDHHLVLLRLARGHKVSIATRPAPRDRTVPALTMAHLHHHHKGGLPHSLPRLVQYRLLRPTGTKTTTFKLPSDRSSMNMVVTSLRISLSVSTRALTATHHQLLDLRVEMQAQTVCGNVDRKVAPQEMVPAAAASCRPSVTTPGQATSSHLPRKAPSVNDARICARSRGMPVFLLSRWIHRMCRVDPCLLPGAGPYRSQRVS